MGPLTHASAVKMLSIMAEKRLRFSGQNPNYPNVLLAAPTGKAAHIIGGMTLHGAFTLDFALTQHTSLSDKKLAKARDTLSNLKLIIIDEMSMVSSDTLYKIHQRLSEIHYGTDDLFANIGIILVGDLLQLRPIQASWIFSTPRDKKRKMLYELLSLWKQFKVINLKHNHRQGEGSQWTELLNRVRIGEPSDDDIKILETLVTEQEDLDPTKTHVFITNVDVTDHNAKMLNKIDSPSQVFSAKKSSNVKGFNQDPKKDGRINNTPFMDKLHLKIGAKVTLLVNVLTNDGMVNGAMGTVVGFEKDKRGEIMVMVSFEEPNDGYFQRLKYPRESAKYKAKNGTPIVSHELKYNPKKANSKHTHSITARVIQIPLRLAWALTCHKIQVNNNLNFSSFYIVFQNIFISIL